MDPAAIALVSKVVGGIFFLIVLGMLKTILTNGFSIAVGEFLAHTANVEQLGRMLYRWSDREVVIEEIKKIREALRNEKYS